MSNCQLKSKYKLIISLFLFTFLPFCLFAFDAFAASPHLELAPSSGTISTSGTNISVNIDTGGQEAKSAKAVINFDADKIEVTQIDAGSFFDEVSHNIYNSTGEVVINANLQLGSSLESKTGTGTLAVMTVQAKEASGDTTNITFDCTAGSSTDSGINDPTPTDIIDCTANVSGAYTLGAGTGASPSPSPSPSAGTGGAGASPSSLPVTGVTGPTVSILLMGVGFILLSIPLFLFV